ncbi:MAG TPA: lysylphosphatidylglycerol synthase transmembrane domain-containing protein [Planctomycetota bacterium]|nr:lysylphosphatidylglycerol synthase transmembrane domain-containing protein [Planctomycetota bacterium]
MWKRVFLVISLTVGIGLFVFFIQRNGGFGKALQAVASVGWTGVGAFIILCAGTMLWPGIGWWLLMRGEKMKVSLWTTLKANFMGFPVNFLAPSMYLGAEPLKIFYVARVTGETKRKILATIVVGKFQEMGALLMTMVIAAGIAVWRIDFPRRQEVMILGALFTLVTLFLIAVYGFVSNRQPTVKVINFLARLGRKRRYGRWRRKLARLRTRAEEMEHLIHNAFTKRWKTFVLAQGITAFSALSVLVRPWFYFYCAHREFVPFEKLSAIYIVTNLINMLPHTPGALGVMEGGMLKLFAVLGLGTDDDANAYQLVGRVSDVVLILLGCWLIFHYNLAAMAQRIAQGKEKVGVHETEGLDEDEAPPTSA